MKTHFSTEEVLQRLVFFPDWKYENEFLTKSYQFENYIQAFAFVAQVAMISEKINHHSNIQWDYLNIKLFVKTHDSGGITNKDFQWIEKINQIPYKIID